MVVPGPVSARTSRSEPVARMRSPAMARAVWPGLAGRIRPFRTASDALLAMVEIVGPLPAPPPEEEGITWQIDEPATACYVWTEAKGRAGNRLWLVAV